MTFERFIDILTDIRTALEDASEFLAVNDIDLFYTWSVQIKQLIDWGRNAKVTTTVAPDTLLHELSLIFDDARGNATPPDWNPTTNKHMMYA